jgi:hypothetical protein
MKLIMQPATFLVIAVVCVIAAVQYVGNDGMACGLFVMGGAALLGAACLHKAP